MAMNEVDRFMFWFCLITLSLSLLISPIITFIPLRFWAPDFIYFILIILIDLNILLMGYGIKNALDGGFSESLEVKI